MMKNQWIVELYAKENVQNQKMEKTSETFDTEEALYFTPEKVFNHNSFVFK